MAETRNGATGDMWGGKKNNKQETTPEARLADIRNNLAEMKRRLRQETRPDDPSQKKAAKPVITVLVVAVTAVAMGLLAGTVIFRTSTKVVVPPVPAKGQAVTTAPVYQPASSAGKGANAPDATARKEEKRGPVAAVPGKKVAKARDKGTTRKPTKVFRKSLEDTLAAAQQGDAEAQYRLGLFYDRGVGVKKDRGAAVKWYRKAASQGHVKAQEALELIYE